MIHVVKGASRQDRGLRWMGSWLAPLFFLLLPCWAGPTKGAVAYVPFEGSLSDLPSSENTVLVVDLESQEVLNQIQVGERPRAIASSPSGDSIYVVNAGDGSVSLIDAKTNSVTASVAVGRNPQAIAVAPGGRRAFVANLEDDTVSVVDLESWQETVVFAVGDQPIGLEIDASGRLYVANYGSDEIRVFDSGTLGQLARISLPSPSHLLIDPLTQKLYVSGQFRFVFCVDTTSYQIEQAINVGPFAGPLLMAPPDGVQASSGARRKLFVGVSLEGLGVIDTATQQLVELVPLPGFSNGISLTPDGSKLLVAQGPNHTICIQPGPPCEEGLLPFHIFTIDSSSLEVIRDTVQGDGGIPYRGRFETAIRPNQEPEMPMGRITVVPNLVTGSAEPGGFLFRSELTLFNLSSSAAAGSIEFFGSLGEPGLETSLCQPMGDFEVAGLQSGNWIFESLGLRRGWARIFHTGPEGVAASNEVTLLRQQVPACLSSAQLSSTMIETAARIEGVEPALGFLAPVVISAHRQSAIAIVNPSSERSAEIEMSFTDAQGESISVEGSVAPLNQATLFVREFFFGCDPQFHEACSAAIPDLPPGGEIHGSIRIQGSIPIAVGAQDVLFPEGRLLPLHVIRIDSP